MSVHKAEAVSKFSRELLLAAVSGPNGTLPPPKDLAVTIANEWYTLCVEDEQCEK